MKENAALFRVSAMCRALSVSSSGYYEWLHRPLSQRCQDDEGLAVQIQGHFDTNRRVYGTRRLKECLAEDGEQVSRRRIGRLMAENDLQVKTKRKFKPRLSTFSVLGQAL